MTARALSFEPMGEQDIDWVLEQETVLQPSPWSRQNFSDSLIAGHSCWLMRDGGKPIGYAIVLVVLDEAHLLNLGVAQSAQGTGLGARLLKHLLVCAKDYNLRQFFLEVRPSNLPALALYRRAGFTEIGRRKGYYASPAGREDALVMRLEL
jgi:ribosomal-protein-alanine N-acetyltransferase